MSDTTTKPEERERVIHFTVDDEPEETDEKELTPNEIMGKAGVDPASNYLEQLVKNHDPISYKGKPDEEIKIKEGMTFVTKPTGPMPVS